MLKDVRLGMYDKTSPSKRDPHTHRPENVRQQLNIFWPVGLFMACCNISLLGAANLSSSGVLVKLDAMLYKASELRKPYLNIRL